MVRACSDFLPAHQERLRSQAPWISGLIAASRAVVATLYLPCASPILHHNISYVMIHHYCIAGRNVDDATRETAVVLLVRIQGNFREAATVIVAWSKKGEGFFGTLKQALLSNSFSERFDDLRAELAARVAVRRSGGILEDPQQLASA